MTKGQKPRNQNGNGSNANPRHRVINPLGAQAALRGAERPTMQVTTRKVWAARQNTVQLVPSTLSTQALGPSGTLFMDTALFFRLSEFYSVSDPVINSYDQYRFKKIVVYASNAGEKSISEYRIWSSVDIDDSNQPNWPELRQRQNTAISVISINNPAQIIGQFRPIANFNSSTTSSSPDNIVPSPMTWFDCSSYNQNYIGLKIHAEAVQIFDQPSSEPARLAFTAFAEIEFRGKI